mgnify:CR=1 FL=1
MFANQITTMSNQEMRFERQECCDDDEAFHTPLTIQADVMMASPCFSFRHNYRNRPETLGLPFLPGLPESAMIPLLEDAKPDESNIPEPPPYLTPRRRTTDLFCKRPAQSPAFPPKPTQTMLACSDKIRSLTLDAARLVQRDELPTLLVLLLKEFRIFLLLLLRNYSR